MLSSDCSVQILPSKIVYKPGETVRGTVQVALSNPSQVSAVEVVYKWKECVYYKTFEGKQQHTISGNHLIDCKSMLVWSSSDTKQMSVAGVNTFHFEFPLATSASPSLFYSDNEYKERAYIMHSLMAKATISGVFNVVANRLIAVVPKEFDVLEKPTPIHGAVTIPLTRCCFSKGEVTTEFHLESNSARPGNSIKGTVVVKAADAKMDLKNLQVNFQEVIYLPVRGGCQEIIKSLDVVKLGAVRKGTEQQSFDIELKVPFDVKANWTTKGRSMRCDFKIILWSSSFTIPTVLAKTTIRMDPHPDLVEDFLTFQEHTEFNL